MMRAFMPALAALFLAAAGGAPAADLPCAADARTALELTIYNSDLALVREVRRFELPEGTTRLAFQDVPAGIDPASLRVDGGRGFSLLEQNYEFDLVSRERILEKYVGRELAWLQEDGSTVTGTLLGVSSGPVYRVDGRIVFEVPGRIALPALPEDLRDRPTLVWLVESDERRTTDVEASYLTGGVSWKADYVLDLEPDGRSAALQAWVTLDNRSGASYAGATVRLVAGDINRIGPEIMPVMMADAAGRNAGAKGFVEEALFDYHVYTLQRPADVKDRQIKQIALFSSDRVPVTRLYSTSAAPTSRRGDAPRPVEVAYRFANDQASGLAVPLPAGTVRVYGQSGEARQFLGEDRIEHTPRDESVELTVGRAFDIVSEPTLVRSERVGESGERRTMRVDLRNHKDEPVTVAVADAAWGEWTVTESTHPVRRIDARRLAFDVAVPAGGGARLEYTLEVRR